MITLDCPRCDGCGQVANTDDAEPWTAWTSLPPGSDIAVRMGLVRPLICPACHGGGLTPQPAPEPPRLRADIWAEIAAERARAHAKHGATSMEAQHPGDLLRLAILTEEIGEVARLFNDARHRGDAIDYPALRKELIQCAAMAGGWADAIEVGA